ncbi:MAG: type III polyketide synthase [Saprospirales bacterium]|nr:MAG: type III polyketide synthase [Saprospirales bacterium]
MTHIQSIGLNLPGHKTSAGDIVQWAEGVFGKSDHLRKFKFLVGRSGIENRYSVIHDFKSADTFRLFSPNGQFQNPPTSDRLEVFENEILALASGSAGRALAEAGLDPTEITHLITVSCTGMRAPGLEIKLSQELGLSDNCERLAVNFMGCYAAFHALKMAHYICTAEPDARVLLCCAEACTLHFRKTQTADDLLTTALFGDGAASLVVGRDAGNGKTATKWLAHKAALVPSAEAMSWQIGNTGFEMKLTQEVPRMVEENIRGLYLELLKVTGRKKADYFAIHPGGKNILEGFRRALNLSDEKMEPSFRVLKDFGNMSSPTVLFVLKEVEKAFLASGRESAIVFTAAFGPGLTIESAMLELKRQ